MLQPTDVLACDLHGCIAGSLKPGTDCYRVGLRRCRARIEEKTCRIHMAKNICVQFGGAKIDYMRTLPHTARAAKIDYIRTLPHTDGTSSESIPTAVVQQIDAALGKRRSHQHHPGTKPIRVDGHSLSGPQPGRGLETQHEYTTQASTHTKQGLHSAQYAGILKKTKRLGRKTQQATTPQQRGRGEENHQPQHRAAVGNTS